MPATFLGGSGPCPRHLSVGAGHARDKCLAALHYPPEPYSVSISTPHALFPK